MQLKKWVIKNKYKLIAGSAFFASLVTIPSVVGTIQANQKIKNTNVEYEYGVPIKPTFDENGKLIIPTIKDPENPTGNYEYKVPEIIDTDVPQDVKESTYYKQGLPKLLDENKNNLLNNISSYSNFKVDTSKDLILLLDNMLPGHKIGVGQDISIANIAETIYESSIKKYNDNILSSKDLSDFGALCGINFQKEYDKLFVSIKHLNMRGGGGSNLPSQPSVPDINKDFGDPQTMTVRQMYNAMKQDNSTKWTLAIAYSVISVTLTILQLILSFFTIGLSVASLIIDIIFCLFEVAVCIAKNISSGEIMEKIKEIDSAYWDDGANKVINVTLEILGFTKLKNAFLLKTRMYSKMLQTNLLSAGLAISIFAATARIIMSIIFEVFNEYIGNFVYGKHN